MSEKIGNPRDIVYVVYNNEIIQGEIVSIHIEHTTEGKYVQFKLTDPENIEQKIFGFHGVMMNTEKVFFSLEDCIENLKIKHISRYGP